MVPAGDVDGPQPNQFGVRSHAAPQGGHRVCLICEPGWRWSPRTASRCHRARFGLRRTRSRVWVHSELSFRISSMSRDVALCHIARFSSGNGPGIRGWARESCAERAMGTGIHACAQVYRAVRVSLPCLERASMCLHGYLVLSTSPFLFEDRFLSESFKLHFRKAVLFIFEQRTPL